MTNPSSAQPTHADVLTINGGSSSIKFDDGIDKNGNNDLETSVFLGM